MKRIVYRIDAEQLVIVHSTRRIGGIEWTDHVEPIALKGTQLLRRKLTLSAGNYCYSFFCSPVDVLEPIEIEYDSEVFP